MSDTVYKYIRSEEYSEDEISRKINYLKNARHNVLELTNEDLENPDIQRLLLQLQEDVSRKVRVIVSKNAKKRAKLVT